MLKKIALVLVFILFSAKMSMGQRIVTLNQAMNISQKLMDVSRYEEALDILKNFHYDIDTEQSTKYEIERLFLIGECLTNLQRYDEAIALYQKLLDYDNKLTRIRIELGNLYALKGEWYRAEKQFKIASADDIPADTKEYLNFQRYFSRKNRKWNAWFSFGAAPDNNFNNAIGGQQCIDTIFGILCRDLEKPKKAMGLEISGGGNYEFRIADGIKFKTELNANYDNYNIEGEDDKKEKDYDSISTTLSAGPRFSFYNVDMWLAGYYTKGWGGYRPFYDRYGVKLNTSFDFSKSYIYLNNRLSKLSYDDYDIETDTYNFDIGYNYNFTSSLFATVRYGYENNQSTNFENYRYYYGIDLGYEFENGLGVELSYTIQDTKYKDSAYYIQHLTIEKLKEHDMIDSYSISLSDRHINIFGFTPIVTFTKEEHKSNIELKNFNKNLVSVSLSKRF